MQTGLPLFDLPRAAQIAAVATAAERLGFDAEAAAAVILDYLQYGDAPAEKLVAECKRRGLAPHDDRAFGAVVVRLSKAGKIVNVGFVRRKNSSPTAVWRLAK